MAILEGGGDFIIVKTNNLKNNQTQFSAIIQLQTKDCKF